MSWSASSSTMSRQPMRLGLIRLTGFRRNAMTVHETAAGQRVVRDHMRRCGWRTDWWTAGGRSLLALVAAGGLILSAACGGATDEGKLPPEVPDPATLHTAAGALARYRSALAEL